MGALFSPARAAVPGERKSRRVWACLLLCLGLSLPGYADEGRFDIRTGRSHLENGVWYASARIDYQLSSEAAEALRSGLSFQVILEIRITRLRRWLPDPEIAQLSLVHQLEYNALSERYVVTNLNSGEQATFATLFSALNYLGRVDDFPVIDTALLSPEMNYEIALRTILDQESLPGPLQVLAFWQDDFSTASDWYRWRLRD